MEGGKIEVLDNVGGETEYRGDECPPLPPPPPKCTPDVLSMPCSACMCVCVTHCVLCLCVCISLSLSVCACDAVWQATWWSVGLRPLVVSTLTGIRSRDGQW